MVIINSDGSSKIINEDGSERPYRFYDRWVYWWQSRTWRRRKKEFKRTGPRYFGDGGAIHACEYLDVEIYRGKVVSVWFRCQALQFKQVPVDHLRAEHMEWLYKTPAPALHGVEVAAEFGHLDRQ